MTDELLKPKYKNRKVNHKYYGHCFHATHALYHLLGGEEKGYHIFKVIDEKNISHYWLENSNGEIIDPTVEQYTDLGRPLPYDNKNGRPSYRKPEAAEIIIERVKGKLKNE